MMLDKELVNTPNVHCDEEGAWLLCSADECEVGKD